MRFLAHSKGCSLACCSLPASDRRPSPTSDTSEDPGSSGRSTWHKQLFDPKRMPPAKSVGWFGRSSMCFSRLSPQKDPRGASPSPWSERATWPGPRDIWAESSWSDSGGDDSFRRFVGTRELVCYFFNLQNPATRWQGDREVP